MNIVIALTSAALSSLFVKTLSVVLILSCYYLFSTLSENHHSISTLLMNFRALLSGCAIVMVLYSLKSSAPTVVDIISMVTERTNMIVSGKFFCCLYFTILDASDVRLKPFFSSYGSGAWLYVYQFQSA